MSEPLNKKELNKGWRWQQFNEIGNLLRGVSYNKENVSSIYGCVEYNIPS